MYKKYFSNNYNPIQATVKQFRSGAWNKLQIIH